MRQIITTNDLGERVEVEYKDEIGQLAQTFNLMVEGLEAAYGHIRRHARTAGVSRLREERLRSTFQTYVPGRRHRAGGRRIPRASCRARTATCRVLFCHVAGFADISESIERPRGAASAS